MKLDEQVNLPDRVESAYDRLLQQKLQPWLRAAAKKLNMLASGRIAAFDELATAAPTAGTWQQGDEIRNSAPTELGSAGSKYVITGWKCVATGTPGTWVQMRTLTGN